MIRIGPAGWSYKDWEGTVYPRHGSRFDPLAYLATYFDTIEVNSSFYRIPPPSHAKSWCRRVEANRDFAFTTKLYRGFTHESTATDNDVTAFRHYLDPFVDAGRLGALLIQFPWSFKEGGETEQQLDRLFSGFDAYPKAVEVRHGSFQNAAFHRFLEERGVAFVNIDQPLFSNSVKPAATVTAPFGYVRMHGRNYEKWFSHEESWERYDYLYSKEQLEPWVERIETMAEGQRDVFVITNNHFRGQAIANAVDLQGALGVEHPVPEQLRQTFPGRF